VATIGFPARAFFPRKHPNALYGDDIACPGVSVSTGVKRGLAMQKKERPFSGD